MKPDYSTRFASCTQVLENQVAFVPVQYFFARPSRETNTMRLNFIKAQPEVLRKAVQTLGELASAL